MTTNLDIYTLQEMSKYHLDLIPDGRKRSIYFDVSKLLEEAGEVAEALNKSKYTDEDVAEELADVICCCFFIALKRNIDLEKAIISKHEKKVKKILERFHNKS